MLSADELRDLTGLEESLWRTEQRFDLDHIRRIHAADFVEFGHSGKIWSTADVIDMPYEETGAEFPLRDFSIREIDSNVALVTYLIVVAHDGVRQATLRSTLWARRDGQWLTRFHQATPVSLPD